MRSIRSIVALVLVGTAAVALLASGAFGVTVNNYVVTALDGTQEWITGHPSAGGKDGNISYKNSGARGQAGPAPTGNLGFDPGQATESSSAPTQTWVGTDYYNNLYLTDLKKITYWSILEKRGLGKQLCDNGDDYLKYDPEHPEDTRWMNDGQHVCHGPKDEQYPEYGHPVLDTDHEKQPRFYNYQPPQIELSMITSDYTRRVLIFRPWGILGKNNWNDCGKWQQWDCLAENVIWWDPMGGCSTGYPGVLPDGTEGPSRFHYWYQIVEHYPGAQICVAPYRDGGIYGEAGNPLQTGFNLVMGAQAISFGWEYTERPEDWDCPDGYSGAWEESYAGKASVDLLAIQVDRDPSEGQDLQEDVYDFQSNYKNAGIIPPSAPMCLNNRMVYDQAIYEPAWGAYGVYPTVNNSLMNAVQRAGYYCVRGPEGGGLLGNQFVVYGLVKDVSGDTFHVDDGSGVLLPCYLYKGFYSDTESVQVGQYLRMEGSLYGNNPGYWPSLNCRYYQWEVNPEDREQRRIHMPPWRFDTYPGKVTVLKEP